MPKVLIIDDESLTVSLLETFLKARGFEVASALNGQDGLILAQVEAPDIIILDMMLPDISGDILTDTIRNDPATAHIPIVILSALYTKGAQDKAKMAGANHYMPKNIQLPELLNQLQRLLK